MKIVIQILIFMVLICNSYAITPEPRLPDAMEQRARNLFLQIKCLVCDGQVIESSDSPVAREMRIWIREQMIQGRNDAEIKDELIKNFGRGIVTSVNIDAAGMLLWLLPMLFFTILIIVYWHHSKK